MPSYNRFGFVGKVGAGTKDNFVDVIILRVEDKAASLAATNSMGVLAQDNAVLSIHTLQKVFKQKLELEGEFAMSAYVTNNQDASEDSSDFEIAKVAGYFLDRNGSTQYAKAMNISVAYNERKLTSEKNANPILNGFMVKAIYDRIDPNYRSMGTYYLRSDLQRIRITAQMRFLKNKLIVAPQIGYENNDLDKTRTAQNKRIIGGLQTTYRVNNNTFLNLGYMNFNSALETNSTDSLILRQVMHNITFSLSNRHEIKENKNNFRFNFSYQTGKNKTTDANSNYLGNLSLRASYAMTIIDQLLILEPSMRVNTYKRMVGGNQLRLTPSLSAKSTFMDKKMSVNYDLASILVRVKGTGLINTAIRNQLRWNYKFHQKQSLSFRLAHQQNLIKSASNYGDLQMDLRYAISL